MTGRGGSRAAAWRDRVVTGRGGLGVTPRRNGYCDAERGCSGWLQGLTVLQRGDEEGEATRRDSVVTERGGSEMASTRDGVMTRVGGACKASLRDDGVTREGR